MKLKRIILISLILCTLSMACVSASDNQTSADNLQINDINTNTILKEFSSMTEAAKHENCSVASISRICNNKQNLNKNYTYIKLGDYQC